MVLIGTFHLHVRARTISGCLAAGLLATVPAVRAQSTVLGHIPWQGKEIEIYDTVSWCVIQGGGRAAAIYPPDQRNKFLTGCWFPYVDDQVMINFKDGPLVIVKKSSVVPVSKGPRKSL